MTGSPAAPESAARRWNRRVLAVFAPILLLTGVAGFVIPPAMSLMSGAPPYNVFHLAGGLVGIGIVLSRAPRAIARFNLGFGLIDLWQAVAGVTGLPPTTLFALRPADHVVHLVVGLALCAVGIAGLRPRRRREGSP